jgi:RHS repeat-associated protein
VSRFVYGDKPTTPELVIRGGAVYRVISDHLGSVRELVNIDEPNDVPVRLDYTAFGSVRGTGAGVIPQGFAGGLYDADTRLVRFGARDYEPSLGRWVSKDPRGFAGGLNFYDYAKNDPVNFVDLRGRNAVAAVAVVAVGALFTAIYYDWVLAHQSEVGDVGEKIDDVVDDLTQPWDEPVEPTPIWWTPQMAR